MAWRRPAQTERGKVRQGERKGLTQGPDERSSDCNEILPTERGVKDNERKTRKERREEEGGSEGQVREPVDEPRHSEGGEDSTDDERKRKPKR